MLGLRIDRTTQRRACKTQVFVHLLLNFDDSHSHSKYTFSTRNVYYQKYLRSLALRAAIHGGLQDYAVKIAGTCALQARP